MGNLPNPVPENNELENISPFIRLQLSLKSRNLLKLVSFIKIPQLKLIEFVAQNPPKNMRLDPQKAIKELGLTITYLKDYQ